MNHFKHLGLFEGIGGFSLAARWMGWETKAWCEWNEFGQKVLKHHFPEAEGYGDITKTDFTKYANAIDIITGGFPCQPYSQAGKRKGKADERHLWPEMLRAIREVRPRWVVGENVYGLINWANGLVFHEVQTDLEAEGYEVWPYVLPAAATNAPHRRDRVWFVAYSRLQRQEKRRKQPMGFEQLCEKSDATDTSRSKPQRGEQQRSSSKKREIKTNGRQPCGSVCSFWQNFPTKPPICGGDDGLPRRLDNITFSKWRNESIKAYGNAIVPQVAYQIFKTIEQYEAF